MEDVVKGEIFCQKAQAVTNALLQDEAEDNDDRKAEIAREVEQLTKNKTKEEVNATMQAMLVKGLNDMLPEGTSVFLIPQLE